MSRHVKAVLLGALMASGLWVSACSELKWAEAPQNEKGHSGFEGGQGAL